MEKVEQSNTLLVEVRAIQREVKNGQEKGKKFLAYQIFNKKTGYFEELRFNSKVKTMPAEEGNYILEVLPTEINRQGTDRRKFPLTWISALVSVSEVSSNNDVVNDESEDLPF